MDQIGGWGSLASSVSPASAPVPDSNQKARSGVVIFPSGDIPLIRVDVDEVRPASGCCQCRRDVMWVGEGGGRH